MIRGYILLDILSNMNNPNFHGLQIEDTNITQIKLGRSRLDQFKAAKAKVLRGDEVPQQADVNLPIKRANNVNLT